MASKRQERLDFEANDYYAYLNLDVRANDAEVKRHFRQLALQWHPDKHQEGAARTRATDIFQQINKAHEVLSDRELRSRYDAVWYQKHQGRRRAVPEWARKVAAGRSGSVEVRTDSGSTEGFWPQGLRAGTVDRGGVAYPQRPASFSDGSRFWEGPRPAASCARPGPGTERPPQSAKRFPPSSAQPPRADDSDSKEGSKKPPQPEERKARQLDPDEGPAEPRPKEKDPELQKREKERMAAQAAWLRRARTEDRASDTASQAGGSQADPIPLNPASPVTSVPVAPKVWGVALDTYDGWLGYGQHEWWAFKCPYKTRAILSKSRFNLIRQRATQQHVDYLRQLDPPRPQRTAEIEPQLRSRVGDLRTTFNHPEIMHQPTETALRSLEPRKSLHYEGRIREVQLEPFGVIEVHHEDIFAFNASLLKGPSEGKGSVARALVLPMASNLLPYRGLALEAFDRGGPELVKDTFHEAQARHSLEKKLRQVGGEEVAQHEIHLEVGAAVEVPLHHLAPAELRQSLQSSKEAEYNKILFSIMPWFWEGSPMDAGKRLRFCAREAFAHAARHCKRVCDSVERSSGIYAQGCVVMPSLATGIFGYQPQDSCRALVEEAFEVLLQLEASEPNYSLHRICFVEANRDVADSFSTALTEVSRRWLPAHKVTTAPQWWGKQTRRLVVLPAVPNFFWRKFKIKFKRRHGVKKRERVNYIGNIKPFLWRAARVRQPPPLLVHQEDGGIAEDQLKARPYFFRGVSHWLFPSRRGGFHSMKRTSRGQWVGVLRNYQLHEAIRPKQ
ncbi:dnaJ [Symbiodinium sp. CCMP2592]|nr:dnaJ [Symbiodinium sp. CCMP2592]